MRHLTIILGFLLFVVSTTFAQYKYQLLRIKLLQADSIILISHEITAGVKIIDDTTGKEIPLPKLLIHGKPNLKIIHERQSIKGKYLDTLINILDPLFHDISISQGMCFMPHHSIFIYKNNKISYFELCFGCSQFETSKDLNFIKYFSEIKWTALEDFFVSLGFKYELKEVSH